jgi:hypothetical protein
MQRRFEVWQRVNMVHQARHDLSGDGPFVCQRGQIGFAGRYWARCEMGLKSRMAVKVRCDIQDDIGVAPGRQSGNDQQYPNLAISVVRRVHVPVD